MRHALLGCIVLLAATALLADPAGCTQSNLFIASIPGEMTAPCAGAIAFTSANYNISHSGGTTGAGESQNVPGTFSVSKYLDKASPKLMLACVNGTHFSSATLTFAGGGSDYLVLDFGNVLVTGINGGGSGGGNGMTESVTFAYQSIKVKYNPQHQTLTGSIRGTARPTFVNASVIGSDGKSTPLSSVSYSVRPGGTTFNTLTLSQPGTIRTGAGRPAEAATLNFGKIHFEYAGQSQDFGFTGGTLVNGNLRVSNAKLGAISVVSPR